MKNEIRITLEKSWRRGSGRETRHKGPVAGVERACASKQREASETVTQVVCDTGDKTKDPATHCVRPYWSHTNDWV